MTAKTIEVDEAEFLQSKALRETVEKMLANPKSRRKILEARKEFDPTAVIPELDQAKPVEDAVATVTKQFEDFKKEQAEKEAKADQDRKIGDLNTRFAAGRAALKKQKWTDEGIKAVEELMEKHGIVDHDVGVAYFERLHPPQVPVTPNGSGAWNFLEVPTEGSDDIKKLIESRGENEPLLRKMTGEALMEVRNTR
jgi:hypothetical protein